MSTFTQILYHITFSTKERRPVLDAPGRPELFRYMWGIVKNSKCHLYRLNGIEDHVHILTSLHPTVALADFIKTIKVSTSVWMKEQGTMPAFTHWQDGYGAFTHSFPERDALIEYVKNQEEHHRAVSFADELRSLLKQAGIKFDEKYLV